MRLTLFKTEKPKRFEFKPRYYDPQKEDLDRRVARAKREIEAAEKNETREELRHRLRHAWGLQEHRASLNRTSNMRIILIAGILFLIFFLLFFTDLLF